MSEKNKKTLNDIGQEASKRYYGHQRDAGDLFASQGVVDYTRNEIKANPLNEEKLDFLHDVLDELDASREAYGEGLREHAEFAKEHEAELRDLALIEARLGGVAINVEQPLEIGEKLESTEKEE